MAQKVMATLNHPGIAESLQMIHTEYREMPGLCLTRSQVQRMWSLDTSMVDALLDALVDAKILRRSHDGHYLSYGTGLA